MIREDDHSVPIGDGWGPSGDGIPGTIHQPPKEIEPEECRSELFMNTLGGELPEDDAREVFDIRRDFISRGLWYLILLSSSLLAFSGSAFAVDDAPEVHADIITILPGITMLEEPIKLSRCATVTGSGVGSSVIFPPPGMPAFIVSSPGGKPRRFDTTAWTQSTAITIRDLTIAGSLGSNQIGIEFLGATDNVRITDVQFAFIDEPLRWTPKNGAGGVRESWFRAVQFEGTGTVRIDMSEEYSRGDGHNNIHFDSCHFVQQRSGPAVEILNKSPTEHLRRVRFSNCFFHDHQAHKLGILSASDPIILIAGHRMGLIDIHGTAVGGKRGRAFVVINAGESGRIRDVRINLTVNGGGDDITTIGDVTGLKSSIIRLEDSGKSTGKKPGSSPPAIRSERSIEAKQHDRSLQL